MTAADRTDAHLDRAQLTGADLRSARLNDADLGGADLTGADLTDAKGVTHVQIDSVNGGDETALPEQTPEVIRPAHWTRSLPSLNARKFTRWSSTLPGKCCGGSSCAHLHHRTVVQKMPPSFPGFRLCQHTVRQWHLGQQIVKRLPVSRRRSMGVLLVFGAGR